jgi:phospholipase C
MSGLRFGGLLSCAMALAGLTLYATAQTPGEAASSTDAALAAGKARPQFLGKINHVVSIFQENRSPDNLFHDDVLMDRGADIATSGKDSEGQTIPLTPSSLVTKYDLGHSHKSFLGACDWNGAECLMDGANLDECTPAHACPKDPEYQYVQASDVQPYFTLAETYTFSDRMFQTNEGPSFPAHQYILSGTSAISETSTTYALNNPAGNSRPDGSSWAGCLAPADAILNLIDTSLPFPNSTYTQLRGPECFEHPTLTDVLDAHGLTWKYYTALQGSIWTPPNAIEHMCQPAGPPNKTYCAGPDWTGSDPDVVVEGSGARIITDVQNGQLASVTWVIPDGKASDHAFGNKGLGPSWVASIVNAIGESPFWSDTAILVTWDDWGGWYDHVAPPIRNTNSYEYGFRVPLIAISPYAKPKYISHQYNDFGSILKFIEETFSLPEIDPAVGYADSYALGDLSDCFNYFQLPLQFTPIASPKDKNFFVHRKVKPTPPDND